MAPRSVPVSAFLAAGLLVAAFPARAGWVAEGTPVCAAPGNQLSPQVILASSGEWIVAWEDRRSGDCDVYAQKIDASGNALWASDGVRVCGAGGDQWEIRMIPDCAGGAIVVWQDSRNGGVDVYGQRVDAGGNALWAASGAPICTAPGDQHYPRVASDGACGAVVVWEDLRNGTLDVYAQRVSAAGGAPMWTFDGMLLAPESGEQLHPVICSLKPSGWLVAWLDHRVEYPSVYAQAIDRNGEIVGGLGGIPCATEPLPAARTFPRIVPDGSGGAVVAWQDYAQGDGDGAVAVQKLASYGRPLWANSGVYLCPRCADPERLDVAPDGTGGAFVVWRGLAAGGIRMVNAQRVGATGALSMVANLGQTGLSSPCIVADGSGGTFVVWTDPQRALRAQKLTLDCAPRWTPAGVRLCAFPSGQSAPQLAPDGSGGVVGVWEDDRFGYLDIYIQRLGGNGAPTATYLRDFSASATGDGIVVRWTLMEADEGAAFEVFRRVPERGEAAVRLDAAIERRDLAFSCLDAGGVPGAGCVYGVYLLDARGTRDLLFETEAVRFPAPALALRRAAPNPFSSSAAIQYSLPASGYALLSVHDVSGRRVANLVSGRMEAGIHEVVWNGRDDRGARVSPGIYFCRLKGCGGTASRKIVLLR